jgi:Plant specific mitochondrial import receptor subunit TOM20
MFAQTHHECRFAMQDCFQSACSEQPENATYKKGLEMTSRAPDLYDEIQKSMHQPPAVRQAGASTFWWDVLGYATVIGGLLAVTAIVGARNQAATGAGNAAGKSQ